MGISMKSLSGEAFPYVILGAGCAGLSLCYSLLEAGVTERILILDRREAFTDDRTWCFWNLRPHPFAALATHCWHSWRVYGPGGDEVRQDRTKTGYARLRATDFYAFVLDRIGLAPNVTLRFGARIDGYVEEKNGVYIRTDRGNVRGDCVFDGRGAAPSTPAELTGMRQHFLGQILQTSAPTFDPTCPTLMDFRVDQKAGLRFLYVLPLSPTEALVENTCLGGPERSPETHRAEIAEYARQFLGADKFQVAYEEAGSIPMSSRRRPWRQGQRVFFVGQRAGASKPSSGYTFLRIQEQCRRITQAIAAGSLDALPTRFAPRRFAFFDAAFLEALERTPERFPAYFCRLFRDVPADSLARFLSETSGGFDECRVAASLPPGPFLRAALTSSPQWLPHLLP